MTVVFARAPWFSDWNYRLLQALFRLIPHHPAIDNFFLHLTIDPLLSSFVFGAVFYLYWVKDDSGMLRRRQVLFRVVVAFAIAVLLSLVVRPWIAWPAPARAPHFRELFPSYLFDEGTENSFPSHSTLAYFLVSAGLWPLNRVVSAVLSLWAVMVISFPRVFLGGHYPVDVLASIVLTFAVLWSIDRWRVPARVSRWLIEPSTKAPLREFLLFLWVFELAVGFYGSIYLLKAAELVKRGLFH